MRGWVGVKYLGLEKMSEIISVQDFEQFMAVHPPAPFAQYGFHGFYPLTLFRKWFIMSSSAQLNLENYIYIGFRVPAIAISLTPY